jgi:hypothetical protein
MRAIQQQGMSMPNKILQQTFDPPGTLFPPEWPPSQAPLNTGAEAAQTDVPDAPTDLTGAITMTSSPTAGLRLSFQAELENWAEGLDYCAVAVPAKVTAALGTRGPVLVMARVNESAPFQVSLFPVGGGRHYIRIKSKVRQETDIRTGDRIRVRFTVLDRAAVAIPDDLMRALDAEGLQPGFQSLPPGRKRFIIRRIEDAAKPKTCHKRVQDAVVAAQQAREQAINRRAHP